MIPYNNFLGGFLIGALAATAGACIGAEVSEHLAPAPVLQVVREACPEAVQVPTSTQHIADEEDIPLVPMAPITCTADLDGMPMLRCGRADPACHCR